MFKNILKHKYFLVLLLALTILAVGMFFISSNHQDTKQSDAGTITFTYTYYAYWNNGDGNNKTGKYVSQDGHQLDESVGTVTVTTEGSGGDWSGTYSTTTKNNGASCKFTVKNKNPFKHKSYSCNTSISASYKKGFSVYLIESSYSGVSGKFGALVWEDYYGGCKVGFVPQDYAIVYNACGGTFEDGNDITAIITTYYESYNLPEVNPTREGYTFLGWWTEDGEKVESTTCFSDTETTTLYARWEANVYTIYFDKQGGEGGTGSCGVRFDSQCINIEVPSRVGYTFLGYYDTLSNGTRFYDEKGVGLVVYTIAEDTTLYARWQANEYNVKINKVWGEATELNGWLDEEGMLAKKLTYDKAYGKLPNLTRLGYTFDCYKFNENVVDERTLMTNAFDHVLIANWIEHSYTIKFNANGGNGSMKDMEGIKFSQNLKLNSNQFTLNGYVFKGWSSSPSGEVEYLDQHEICKLSATDKDVITLYALWEKTWSLDGVAPSGNGSENSPYLIASAQNLAWLANKNFGSEDFGGYYKQVATINLADKVWLPIGNETRKFIGNYDGNGFVITGLAGSQILNGQNKYIHNNTGLFGVVASATIKQINLMSGNVYGNDNVGSIVGYAKNSTITACQTYAQMNSTGENAGGIVGRIDGGKIENCYSQAQLTGKGKFGGVVGVAKACEIVACGFEGGLVGDGKLLVGESNSTDTTINDCFAYVANDNAFYGGSASIENCLFIAGGKKCYYNGTFSNWVISKIKEPLPSGLYWLATGGDKVSDISQIEALGYKQI